MNKALAKLTRIRHPPEKSLVFLDCISWVNPSPLRMERALTSAVEASIASNRSYTALSASMISSCSSSGDFSPSPPPPSLVLPPPNFSGLSMTSVMSWLRSSARCSSLLRSSSTSMTASSALKVSLGSTSSLRKKISIELGTGSARAPRAFSSVLLPHPLRPTNPYLFPWFNTTEVSSISTAPMCISVTFVTLMSRARASTPLRDVAKVQTVPAAANASEAS
mmetsp:Transcript_12351/g.26063  ORF Transcript_12351/g.26063 Transcript_12351/m.26063 type:complete len:222 (+) Transcript_12351:1634-2299(+)